MIKLPGGKRWYIWKFGFWFGNCHAGSTDATNCCFVFQMKKKYADTSLDDDYVFPEGLKKVVTHAGFFRKTPDKKHLDPDTIQIISMLHLSKSISAKF